MKTIVDNLAIEYTDDGNGPIVLMLHGWADTLHTFDPILRYITKYRIIRVDLPGFGGSERPKEPWGVEEYARFVAAFCKKIDRQPDVLIGHSFGGRVAIKGVGTGLLSPQKLILIGSAGVVHPPTFRRMLLRVVAKLARGLTLVPPFSLYRQTLRKRLYDSIGSDYFTAGSMSGVYIKVIAEDLLQYARNINISTLLVWGKQDSAVPLADGQKIHQAIRGSQLKVIDGASHFVHQEKPELVAKFIQDFVPAPLEASR